MSPESRTGFAFRQLRIFAGLESDVLDLRGRISRGGKKRSDLEHSGGGDLEIRTSDRFQAVPDGERRLIHEGNERELIFQPLHEKKMLVRLIRNLDTNPTYDGVGQKDYAICKIEKTPARGESDSPAPEEGSG